MRPSRPSHSQGASPHRPPFSKPTTSPYDSSYATWNHDRPTNDLAVSHNRPTYTTSRPPYHTIQVDYSQDEYDGYPTPASGIHVSTFEDSNTAMDYSRYRGNRTRMHMQTCCTDMCRARCVSRSMKPINRRVWMFSMLLGAELLLPTLVTWKTELIEVAIKKYTVSVPGRVLLLYSLQRTEIFKIF